MKKIVFYIKNYVASKIRRILFADLSENIAYYSNMQVINKLDSIRSMPFCTIKTDFFFGQGLCLKIEGNPKLMTIGEKVRCNNFCNFLIYENASLKISQNVFFNNYCSINCLDSIEIGENTLFGEGVKIYDHNHKSSFTEKKLVIERNDFTTSPVKIGKNCWIGSNVTILKGVQIGDNVIIGANCLIYKSIPANTLVKSKSELILENL